MIYRSNLTCPDLSPHFKHLFCTVGAFGHDVPHDWADKADDDSFFSIYKKCGFWTHDEAAILWNIVKRSGLFWLDIGAHTGWTGSHIMSAGGLVTLVDPLLMYAEPAERLQTNLRTLWPRIQTIHHDASWTYFGYCRKFTGVCIDGDHSAPVPLEDAQGAHKHLTENGVIVFHDFIGTPVQEAVAWLIRQGYKYRIYNTPQMVACCWRGDFDPPEHVCDPAIAAAQPFDWNKTEWWR